MKKLIALLTAITLITPAIALAEQGPGGGLDDINDEVHTEAEVHDGPGGMRGGLRAQAELHASTTNPNRGPGPGLPKLGPAIHALASTTRGEFRMFGSTTGEMVKHRVDAIHDLIEKHKEAMRERAEAARQKAHEHFGEKIEHIVGNISERLASTSLRLSGIADRIDVRIDELQGQGFAMGSSTTLLAKAQSDIATANVKITAVNTALASAMSMGTTTAKAEIPAVRTAVKAAEDALKLVKEDLMNTLKSVKAESAATTTASTI